ncbi:right-handed parallel beta-helix repeat-containing protein, partial [Leptolyngbya sp. FACHB-36]|uniref:right-handed parallel beta-helix repeat-containing protein n=1 Tax=Leptolyngbya sp. FACHB-36 TaxID=2692808 RepID=UPI0032200406
MLLATPAWSQSAPGLQITVTSSEDGPVAADGALTLREAIELANGTLTPDKLSSAEQALVQSGTGAQIRFNLPAGQTTIRLNRALPDLTTPGLVVDGTTQPGYDASRSAINELSLPVPVVAITAAPGIDILRGLTITADGITVRGLSIYGFTGTLTSTASTPPADIFIAHRFPPPDIRKHPTPANFSPFYSDDVPPKNVVIENNWIGLPPSAEGTAQSDTRSAFGVSVFNGVGTVIRRNWIANHDGSGIITSVDASRTQVIENAIIGNGVAGMPDAIRLEGTITQSLITGNLICGNDGSGVYLFKPSGAAQIQNNQIIFNGRRLRRAAVYLMGNDHQVTNNQIRYQAGPGVVVAAFPRSTSQIQGNRFSQL